MVPVEAENDPEVSIRSSVTERELDIRRVQLYTALNGTQQVIVRRSHLVSDAIEQYQDSAILKQKIFVTF